MVIVSPDGNVFSDVMVFNLQELASRLLLVVGFSNPLSSLPFIATAIQLQNDQILAGTLPNLVSFLVASLGLEIMPLRNLPPWMVNAPDHTQVYVSPVTTFPIPNQPWYFDVHHDFDN